MRKKLAVILAVFIFLDLVGISAIVLDDLKQGKSTLDTVFTPRPDQHHQKAEEVEDIFTRASFVAVGDNLIHNTVYEQAEARSSDGYDFSYAYQYVADLISEPDVAILNQETLISTEHNPSSYPTFNSPQEVGEEMLEIGFDVFNIATNHSLDKGESGLISTINYWKSKDTADKDVLTTGAYLNEEDYQTIPTHEVNGIKIAYVGFTESTNGLSLPSDSEVILMLAEDEEKLRERIMAADAIADVVIVNAHWGEEYSHRPNSTQRNLAEKMASWGADVIIGTHPHVIQPVEYVDNGRGGQTLVAYSLGNFISAQNKSATMLGGMLNFEVVKNHETGKITFENVKFSGVVNHYGSGMSNIRIYPLADYTQELAGAHGMVSRNSEFDREYLQSLLEEVVDEEFLY